MPEDTEPWYFALMNTQRAWFETKYPLQEYRLGIILEKNSKGWGKLIYRTIGMDKSIDVYKYVHKNEEEYLDFIDDFPSIKPSLKEPKIYMGETQDYIEIFDESSAYILSEN